MLDNIEKCPSQLPGGQGDVLTQLTLAEGTPK